MTSSIISLNVVTSNKKTSFCSLFIDIFQSNLTGGLVLTHNMTVPEKSKDAVEECMVQKCKFWSQKYSFISPIVDHFIFFSINPQQVILLLVDPSFALPITKKVMTTFSGFTFCWDFWGLQCWVGV